LLAIPTHNVRDLAGHRLNRMYMAGQDVFKFAVRVVDEGIRQCLDKAGVALEDVRLVVPHQANQRILASVAKRLKMDSSMFMSNVERYGNTSAASIPIALCEAIEQKRVRPNDHIVLIGFGGGLTWAAAVIKWGIPMPEAPLLNKPRRQFAYALADVRTRLTRLQRAYSALRRRMKKMM
jgi:3-oxoacyl-[acyl-carrier-protein] synthase III